jgi:alkylation response protein AidB-like acyl-CoA dehydrogenase
MTDNGSDSTVDRVAAIAGLIEGAAAEAEKSRRIPPAVLEALHENGLFRMLLPAAFGGLELGPPDFLRAIEAVAKLDASTAWCLCQANGCAMTAAYLPEDVVADIWPQGGSGVLAWGPGAKCTARFDESSDSYLLSGSWSFASGMRHASWLGGHAVLIGGDGETVRDDDGDAVIKTFLFRAEKAEVKDIWDVIGLRATASDGYSVKDLPVAAAYAVGRDDIAERRSDQPLYQFPAMSLFAFGFAATARGIARTMLETFKELTKAKRPRLARNVMKDDGMIQADTATAEARLKAARAYLVNEAEDIWTAVKASGELSVDQRMRIRLAATFVIHEAKAVADLSYDLAGATAIFSSAPYERRFRDIHTVAQQLQGRKAHMQTVGGYLLGHPADMSVI